MSPPPSRPSTALLRRFLVLISHGIFTVLEQKSSSRLLCSYSCARPSLRAFVLLWLVIRSLSGEEGNEASRECAVAAIGCPRRLPSTVSGVLLHVASPRGCRCPHGSTSVACRQPQVTSVGWAAGCTCFTEYSVLPVQSPRPR
jgi:hypothetical protein